MNEIVTLFRQLTLGVYVIGVSDGTRRDAFTAAWVTQVAFEPLLLAVSVNRSNASYPLLRAGGQFTVNVLKRGQVALAAHFGTQSGRDVDKLADVATHATERGAPILVEALAWFECDVVGRVVAGDHDVVLGRVVAGEVLDHDAEPLPYAETDDLDGSSALYPSSLGEDRS